MNVLHIYRTYFPDPPGGLQEAIRQICVGCKDLGVSSAVYTLSPTPKPLEFDRPEAHVYRSRSWMAPASCDLGAWHSLTQFSRAAAWADVLHFHFPWPYGDVLNLLPAARQKPRVMTYHSDIVKQKLLGALYSPLMRHTLATMDKVIATSPPYARTSEVLKANLRPEQLKVIPLGMADIDQTLPLAPEGSALIQRLGLEDKPFVLALGVLRYYKGLNTLVAAAKAINGTVVIAGSGPEGEALRQQAREAGLNNVVFAGQVSEPEKMALLRHCTAMALPSHLRSEAYGMVLLEAAIHGKPMISCEIGTGTSFINQHEKTGFVIKPEDPAALSHAANALLHNRGLAETYGMAARARYEENFTDRIMAQSYHDLYHEVCRKRPGTTGH
ncbi:glycosyltransferase [Hydrogenophaga sp. 5NK40-0174]|uniref:glycosyltransferase n=1 Tax=Hydrogenophaga sp. 5NK40-0174 TaxID=3127649 RepID=UPI0031058BB7